jgi:Ion channel
MSGKTTPMRDATSEKRTNMSGMSAMSALNNESNETDDDDDNTVLRQPEYMSVPATRSGKIHRSAVDADDEDSNFFFFSEPSVSEESSMRSRIRAPHRKETVESHLLADTKLYGRPRMLPSSDGGAAPAIAMSSSEDDELNVDTAGGGESDDNNDPQQSEQNYNQQSSQLRIGTPGRRRPRHQQDYTMSPGNTSLSSWENSPAVGKKVFLQFVMPESKYSKQARRLQPQQVQQGRKSSNIRIAGNDSNPDGRTAQSISERSDSRSSNGSQIKANDLDARTPDSMEGVGNIVSRHDNPDQFSRKIGNMDGSPPLPSNLAYRRPIQTVSSQRVHCSGPLNRDTGSDTRNNDKYSVINRRNSKDGVERYTRQHRNQRANNNDDVFSLPSTVLYGSRAISADESVALTLSDSEIGDAGDHIDESVTSPDRPADWEAQHSADDEKTADRPPRIKAKTMPGHKRTRSGDGAAATLLTGSRDWRGMEFHKIPLPAVEDAEDDDESHEVGANRRLQRHRRSPGERPVNIAAANGGPVENNRRNGLNRGSRSSQPGPELSISLGCLPPLPDRENSKGNNKGNLKNKVEAPDSRQAWVSKMAQIHQKSSVETSTTSFSQARNSLQDSPPQGGGSINSLEQTPDEEDLSDSNSNGEGSNAPAAPIHKNRLHFDSSESLDLVEDMYEGRDIRGTGQAVLRARSSHNPFANFGKQSAEKAPRAAFLPFTHDQDKEYQTFICPRCKTRQREFFTVENVAGQLEGPGSYLALYFFIYVMCSLFIFGLEEGWMPLDCIYFAVITLTTAGLGDFVPTSNANKIICSIFIYFGVACIGLLLGSYIAGMLDDKAHRDRKARQAEACPNCSRLKSMRESAVKRGKDAMYSSMASLETPRFMSERTPGTYRQEHTPAVYAETNHLHHHTHRYPQQQDVQLYQSTMDEDADSTEDVGMPGIFDAPEPKQNYWMAGSPVTQQILGRQKHTRHASIDVGQKKPLLADGSPVLTYGRTKFSESFPTHTLAEFSDGNEYPAEPSGHKLRPIASGLQLSDYIYESDFDDDSSSVSSYSGSSSFEEIWDTTKGKILAAKYVFLTLRRALVNSLVIIAVGCFGFSMIEGFTIIDSWYFTTVLLTTVG